MLHYSLRGNRPTREDFERVFNHDVISPPTITHENDREELDEGNDFDSITVEDSISDAESVSDHHIENQIEQKDNEQSNVYLWRHGLNPIQRDVNFRGPEISALEVCSPATYFRQY